MDSLSELRQKQAHSQIADLLIAGQSRNKIANDANMRPEAFEALLHSDEFIAVLANRDEDLATQLLEERQAKEDSGLELIIQAEGNAARFLVNQLDHAETPALRTRAAMNIIELAEKLKGKKDGRVTAKVVFPPNQLKVMYQAAMETDRACAE